MTILTGPAKCRAGFCIRKRSEPLLFELQTSLSKMPSSKTVQPQPKNGSDVTEPSFFYAGRASGGREMEENSF